MTRDLSEIDNFIYQLQDADPDAIGQTNTDLVIVDYSRDGDDASAYSAQDVESMQLRDQGSDRVVLSYLSIGEAEDYRFYWQKSWNNSPPSWLDEENPDWPGNYKVEYWQSGWQNIIFGNEDAYLDKIIAAGFDGVYLDIIDAFEYYENSRPTAAQDMADFVSELATYARALNPDFVIIGQNGESLVTNPTYLNAIDGVAKEDLYYGLEGDGQVNEQDEVDYADQFLQQAQNAGKLILNVEYLTSNGATDRVLALDDAAGYVPLITDRELDELTFEPAPAGEVLSGDDGNNTLRGGGGQDSLFGQGGNDQLFGQDYQDFLQGNAGDDYLQGNRGDDTLRGGADDDTLRGGQDDDFVKGDKGSDLVQGDKGSDFVRGGKETDTLRGGQGNDSLYGDKGDDTLFGDKGDDDLYGGSEADLFVFRSSDGHDRILDFNVDEGDRLLLRDGQAFSSSQSAEGVVLTFEDGSSLLLAGQDSFSTDWLA
ncbi:MJ1477/TM1410 family putative glycoside hydrolase [Rhodovibrionaceae bacterium A322]